MDSESIVAIANAIRYFADKQVEVAKINRDASVRAAMLTASNYDYGKWAVKSLELENVKWPDFVRSGGQSDQDDC